MFKYLSFKEKLASGLCAIISFLMLSAGLYDYLFVKRELRDLIMSIGVFLMLLSGVLTPKMFFSPISDIWKVEEFPSIVDPKIPQWLSLSGISLCAFCLVWNLLP